MKYLLLFLTAFGPAFGQTSTFNGASLAGVCTGVPYSSQQQPDLEMIAPPFNTLVYAKSFTCTIPVTCSLCSVTLGFMENRLTAIGPRQRLFTVGFNGNLSDSLDLFTLAGPQISYRRTWTVPVYNGVLKLTLSALVLNALLSEVVVKDYLPSVPTAVVMQCLGPTGPDSDCTGLFHIAVTSPLGVTTGYIAFLGDLPTVGAWTPAP